MLDLFQWDKLNIFYQRFDNFDMLNLHYNKQI